VIGRWGLTPFFLVAVLAAPACGKKGPPLPPLLRLPAAVSDLTARRIGRDVTLRFTVPAANTDGSRPADLARIEIYAHLGKVSSPADFLTDGMLVRTVIVNPAETETVDPVNAVPSQAGVKQGEVVAVSEAIDAAAPADESRYYVVVGVNTRGRRGPASSVIGVPLVEAPPPPQDVEVTYDEKAISVAWKAVSDYRIPDTDSSLNFDVYEVDDTAAGTPVTGLEPLNESPSSDTSVSLAGVEFGRRRCFAVRSTVLVDSVSVDSESAPPVCVTPVDTFPPASPRALSAVATENSVSLIWEANTEPDLAGYLVLRAEAPGETLTPLTPAPIRETTYRDSTVRAAATYVYAIVAVDNAAPPNFSGQSDPVTQVAR
jgi:hypothetical protein